jgi:drug/metabolite transporter (DMT)-like permease
MPTVLLATATAAFYGVADFFGGLASRRDSAVAVTATAHGIGVAIFALALLLFPAPFDRISILAGLSAGVTGAVGVSSLYAALARGRMSVVAPLTAALSGSIPALYDFARGSRLSPVSLAGLVLALFATVVVSAASAEKDPDEAMPLSAVLLSLLAGVAFAGSFISFSLASHGSGFWPLVTARVMSFSLLAAVLLVRRRHVVVGVPARRLALTAGTLDAIANIAMISAIRLGPLAVASAIGSLYPVGTVVLARFVLGERIRGWQRVGVALAIAAVVLAAAG